MPFYRAAIGGGGGGGSCKYACAMTGRDASSSNHYTSTGLTNDSNVFTVAKTTETATLGNSITVNEAGVYHYVVCVCGSGGYRQGRWTLNGTVQGTYTAGGATGDLTLAANDVLAITIPSAPARYSDISLTLIKT